MLRCRQWRRRQRWLFRNLSFNRKGKSVIISNNNNNKDEKKNHFNSMICVCLCRIQFTPANGLNKLGFHYSSIYCDRIVFKSNCVESASIFFCSCFDSQFSTFLLFFYVTIKCLICSTQKQCEWEQPNGLNSIFCWLSVLKQNCKHWTDSWQKVTVFNLMKSILWFQMWMFQFCEFRSRSDFERGNDFILHSANALQCILILFTVTGTRLHITRELYKWRNYRFFFPFSHLMYVRVFGYVCWKKKERAFGGN